MRRRRRQSKTTTCVQSYENLTSSKIPRSKENKEEVRDKTDDVAEEREVGKVGHEGTTVDRTDFEPCRNHSV